MLEIINEETIDGYKIITYSNGAVVKQILNATSEVPVPEPTPQDILDATTTAKLNKILLLLGGAV